MGEGGIPDELLKGVLEKAKVCKTGSLLSWQNEAENLYSIDFEAYRELHSDISKIKVSYLQKTAFPDRNHKSDYMEALEEINNRLRIFLKTPEEYKSSVEPLATEFMEETFVDTPFYKIVENSCGQFLEIEKKLEVGYGNFGNLSDEVLRKTQKSLGKGIPIYYSYYDSKFKKVGYRNSSSHASTIVAQRWNDKKNRCEFKIRNSWGKDCFVYRKDIDCIAEEGSFWASDREVYENGIEVFFLHER